MKKSKEIFKKVLTSEKCYSKIQFAVLKVHVNDGPVAQLVRAPPCHGGGRGFESLPGRLYGIIAQLGEHLPYKQRVIGSSPIGPTYEFNMPMWLNWQSS